MRLSDVFPENEKMTTPTIKDNKVTYSTSSLKL